MIKVFSCFLLVASGAFSSLTYADIKLGASPLATYIDNDGEPARLNTIVEEAFKRMGQPAELAVMRRAFLGSALSTGQLDGEYAFISLDNKKSTMLYSRAYLPVKLYVASKRPSVKDIKLLPQLQDSRIAIENRFANTDQVRAVREVKWSRNPTTFDAFKQFADERAPLLMTTALLINEFNKLLKADNEELVFQSAEPLLSQGFHISLTQDNEKNRTVIRQFNQAISDMQRDGTYNNLLGLSWISKDINEDGIADFITSSTVYHEKMPPNAVVTYALDSTKPADASLYVIDGKPYSGWDEADLALTESYALSAPASVLDEEIYKKIIRQW